MERRGGGVGGKATPEGKRAPPTQKKKLRKTRPWRYWALVVIVIHGSEEMQTITDSVIRKFVYEMWFYFFFENLFVYLKNILK
jgi:hypothetical protein